MLSHDSCIFVCKNYINHHISKTSLERIVSHLPLSHIAGLIIGLMLAIIEGTTTYCAKPDAMQGSIIETLKWAKPTWMFTVPRLYEKLEEYIV